MIRLSSTALRESGRTLTMMASRNTTAQTGSSGRVCRARTSSST